MISRERALRLAVWGQIITGLGVVGLGAVIVRAIVFTPVERVQGPAQKIFYVHVPAAWWALVAFALAGVLSIAYLWLKDRRVDLAAASVAEVGVAFAVVMLTTGPFWGKPVWGAWWVWDARLTSTLFIFLLFVGYLVLRGSMQDYTTRANYSAVVGILGLVLVPFVHLTVYLFRTQHPEPVVLKPEGPTLPASMLTTLLISLGVFTILFIGFVVQRYALAVLDELRQEELHRAA